MYKRVWASQSSCKFFHIVLCVATRNNDSINQINNIFINHGFAEVFAALAGNWILQLVIGMDKWTRSLYYFRCK